jgi:hypothetical protein
MRGEQYSEVTRQSRGGMAALRRERTGLSGSRVTRFAGVTLQASVTTTTMAALWPEW